MSNVLSGGSKFHLKGYKGIVIKNGKSFLTSGQNTNMTKACSGRYSGTLSAAKFIASQKKYPEEACQKCAAKLKNWIEEGKKLKA